MSCKTNNLTAERVQNIMINGGMLFEKDLNLSYEDRIDRMDWMNDNLILHETSEVEDDSYYTIFGERVSHRVSELATAEFVKRQGPRQAKKIKERPNTILFKKAGIKIHKTMSDLIENIYNNKGDIREIRSRAAQGSFPITQANFNELERLSRSLISQIEEVQNSIDPSKKAVIRTEQKVINSVENRGGSIDLLAFFSDNSAAIYDFKSKHSTKQNYENFELINELLGYDSVHDYELNMAEYSDIAVQNFDLTNIRQNRLVPIHIRLNVKPRDQQADNDIYSDQFELIQAGGATSKYLEQIPVRGEATKYKSLNALLEKQFVIINKLNKRLTTERLSGDERDRLKAKIAQLRKALQKTIVDGEITDIVNTCNRLIVETESRIGHPKELDGEPNPKFLDDRSLLEILGEVAVYKDIIDNTHDYFKDIKQQDEGLFNRLTEQVGKVSNQLQSSYNELKEERDRRILDRVPDMYKQPDGSLGALPTLDFFTRTFNRISEIDHPIFKTAWDLIQSKLQQSKNQVNALADELDNKQAALFKWAKQNGLSRTAAFEKLINFETGNLQSMMNKEFWDIVNSVDKLPVEEGAAIMKDLFEIEDYETFKNDYNTRLTNYKERQLIAHEGDEAAFKKDLIGWVKNNNLVKFNEAWVNPYNRGRLKIKPEILEKYKSDEYRYIEKNKPLLDYYEMYVNYNKEFRDLLGISRYRDLPPNFIPNIRKEMADFIGREGFNLRGTFSEFIDSFRVREEDVYLGERDYDGEIHKRIPIMFLNPFRDKDGNVDMTRKSYDLGRSLVLFGKMAYNYAAMHEIEPTILFLREYMSNPSAGTPGTEVTTRTGRKVKGMISKIATKAGMATDEYKLFENMTDYYLYGIKFKEKSLSKSFDTVKFILKLKDYYSKRSLSFAALPSIGAFFAGQLGMVFEGKKGISYTSKSLRQARKEIFTENAKAVSLARHFHTYAEDPVDKRAHKLSIKTVKKIVDTRTLFMFLRKVDERIVNLVTTAMLHDWGINDKGKLIRLTRKDIDTSRVKSLWDSVVFDEKTQEWTIPNMTEEAFLDFRNAVKGTTTNIIGSLSHEDISQGDLNLIQGLLMQFKTWAPGLAREHFGNLNYDTRIQAIRWGRFKAALNEFSLTKSEKDNAIGFMAFISRVVIPNLARGILDLVTFGLAYRSGMIGTTHMTDHKERMKVRGNLERARRRYIKFVTIDNPHLQGKLSFDEFLETRNAQLTAMLVEMRAILGFLMFLSFLGAGGDDDEPRYMSNYITRTIYKSMAKTQSELTFMWNPDEFARLLANPLPLARILQNAKWTWQNTVDETRDLIYGENSPYDNSPMLYQTIQWAYGGNQLARFFEVFEVYKKAPNY